MYYGYYRFNKNYNVYAMKQYNRKQAWIKKHNAEKEKENKENKKEGK